MEGENIDWNNCKTLITEAHKNFMKNHFSRRTGKSISFYQQMFFSINPNATQEECSSWVYHYWGGMWEENISWMTEDEFKYQWPPHYSFIMDIHSEEESNRNGSPSIHR